MDSAGIGQFIPLILIFVIFDFNNWIIFSGFFYQ